MIDPNNYLSSDTVSGAKASGIEPYQYLKTVLKEPHKAKTIKDVEALLPLKAKIEMKEAA